MNIINTFAKITGILFSFLFNHRNITRFSIFLDKSYSFANAKYFHKFSSEARISRTCVIVNPQCISIGYATTIGYNCTITAWPGNNEFESAPEIIIGDNTSIGSECHLTAINKLIIGNNVLFGKKITVSDNSHGDTINIDLIVPPSKRHMFSKGPVIIEDNVWIGDKTTILPGSVIGFGSIIGANSVVNGIIPPGSMAAGVPAKVIRKLNQHIN